jgi:hypothetical protein
MIIPLSYSGVATGESQAYEIALSNFNGTFGACPTGNFDGANTTIAISPTGSGYNSSLDSSTYSPTGVYTVTITPALNANFAKTFSASGCTKNDADLIFASLTGEAMNGLEYCPICLNDFDSEGTGRHVPDGHYNLDFKWVVEKVIYEYDGAGNSPPSDPLCSGHEPYCTNCTNFAVLSGWEPTVSGSEQGLVLTGNGQGQYKTKIADWTGTSSSEDVILTSQSYSGNHLTYGDRWRLDIKFATNVDVGSHPNGVADKPELGVYFNSGLTANCLEAISTDVPTGDMTECFARNAGVSHPSTYGYLIDETWKVRVYDIEITKSGVGGPFGSLDVHAYVKSGSFSNPSICDPEKYFHFYDCDHLDLVRTGNSLDNCSVLEAMEAAPQSGYRIKMPASQWHVMSTGDNWAGARTGNPNGESDDCTVSNLGSGLSFSYVTLGGFCGALIERQNDSGVWSGVTHAGYTLGTWSGYTYIDNIGCSGCFSVTGSGNIPDVLIPSGTDCSGYNACVDASGHSAC